MENTTMDNPFNYDTNCSKELAEQLAYDLHTMNNNLYVKLGNNYYQEKHEQILKDAFELTKQAQFLVMHILRENNDQD